MNSFNVLVVLIYCKLFHFLTLSRVFLKQLSERIMPEMHRFISPDKETLLLKKSKRMDDNITLILNFHPALNLLS